MIKVAKCAVVGAIVGVVLGTLNVDIHMWQYWVILGTAAIGSSL